MNIYNELEKCEALIAVWLILKAGNVCGRIMARYSRSGGSTFVTLELYGYSNPNGEYIADCVRMTGYGYDRTREGIIHLLQARSDRLNSLYGLNLPNKHSVIGNWEALFSERGFSVIRAV